ncbi:MAG: T9SS type A sorting domain-containing protein [Flavobacterium sp.]
MKRFLLKEDVAKAERGLMKFSWLLALLIASQITVAQSNYSWDKFGSGTSTMTNDSPTGGIISQTVQAPGSPTNYYLVQWDGYANKWSNTSTPYNSVFTLTWGGGSFNGPNGAFSTAPTAGKYYTMQVRGLSYSNRQGVVMETTNAPRSFHATASTAVTTPSNVCANTSTTITVTLAGAKSPEERVFIRYTKDNFSTSKVVEATATGTTWTTATATIPGSDNTDGATVRYYAYTTTVAANDSSDHDLITLRFGNNNGGNYSYDVKSQLDYVNLQAPFTGSICANGSFTAYGQVYEPGVTPGSGQGANITAQIGYSAVNSNTDPSSDSSWTWINATYNSSVTGNNDEYIGTIPANALTAAGAYYYAFRYSYNGCAYQYGGKTGSWTSGQSGSITVQALPASAGSNGTLNICSTTPLTTALLFGALTGSPAAGGTWSPALNGAGTYTYTQAATSPCTVNNTATVVVTVQQAPASAGSNGTLNICSTTPLTTALLFGALTGSPAAGGTWSPALNGAGTYTYTQAATSPCTVNNTATVVVTVQQLPASAGSNGTLNICSTTPLTTALLFGALTGSPAAGGTWSPALNGAGTYTYTQAATSPCTADNTATVVVNVQQAPASAGSNGTLNICSTTPLTTALLFGALTGSPAAGGTWSPALNGAGTYTYTQAATSPCTADNTATVVVTITTPTLTVSGAITPACGATSANLTSVVSSNGTVSYFTNSGYTTPVATPTAVTTAGIYYARATLNGCTTDSTITVDAFRANPVVTASNVSGCAGTPIALSGSPAGGSFSVANPYTGTSSTTYTYTYTDGNGCSATSASANITITAQPLWYLDADGDHYYTGAGVPSCTSPGAGYTTTVAGGNDCDDNNVAINPGAAEICYNNIDDNCNGASSESCAPVVVNMTASYNGTTLTSFSTAVPAVGYTYPGATNLKYRFSVTNTTTGVTAPDVIQATRYVTIPLAIQAYNASYTIKASAVINEEVVPFAGNIITINAPTVQLVGLSSTSCGATLAALTTTIASNPGLNATGYTFRIRLNDSNPNPTYAYSQSSTRYVVANSFTGFPLQYSTSYKIAVQFTFNDPVTNQPVQSGYGAECVVNTPSIPVVGIASPSCGSQVAAMNTTMTATAASYATGYQFRIRLFGDNGSNPTYFTTAVLSSRFSALNAFQGITLAYSTEYSISVRYSILNGSTTVWSNYGPECKITTPFFPTTSLVPSQCGLEAATPMDRQLNITPYPGFPHYMVKIDELGNSEDPVATQEKEISYSYFKLSDFSLVQLGKRYNISVAIKLNGVFGDYSTACDLHTAEVIASDLQKTKPVFKAMAYPNPFANNFMINLSTTGKTVVNVKVYDMIGRMIEQTDVKVSDMESTTIGNNYPSGVYNLVVSQGDNVETLRVVKR